MKEKRMYHKSNMANGALFAGITSSFDKGNKICRDFLRNVCHRGKRCKYIHEKSNDEINDEYTFCHDFQNGVCNWPECKFLHCSENEEKHFRLTGELPVNIINQLRSNIDKQETQLCKDYFNGNCQRTNCKFRHFKKEEVLQNLPVAHNQQRIQSVHGITKINYNGLQDPNNYRQIDNLHTQNSINDYNISAQNNDYLGPPEPKRRMVSSETVLHFETAPIVGQHSTQPIASNYFYPVINRNEARLIFLEDENTLLKNKIEELKKQVNDLTATNEFLLDQNAQLRISGKRTANVTAVTVPAVTITNTVPPPQAPTPQQMVNAAVAAGTLRTVTASVATVPVSLATVTPVSIAAVSMAPVSMATVSMAPVSIPPPIVTMAQQTITMSGSGPQPNNPQSQNNQQSASLPLSISGATAPLVSYPIMTQELRPVLQ